MMVDIKFHNVDHSDALEGFVIEKSTKMERFLRSGGKLQWVIDFKGKLFSPALNVLFHGKSWHLTAASASPYEAVQQVAKRAYRILSQQSSLQRARVKLRSKVFDSQFSS